MAENINLSPENEDELFRFLNEDEMVSSEKIVAPRYSYWKSVFRVFFRKKINIFLLAMFVLILLAAYVGPCFLHYEVMENVSDASSFNLSPSRAMEKYNGDIKYLLGTGPLGNSIFFGLFSSARTSLSLALICTVINMFIGIFLGAFWGYSKKADVILLVIYNIVANVPLVLVQTVLVYAFGSGFWFLVLAFCLIGWFYNAYSLRLQVMVIRDREYSLASRCLGTPISRIISKNVLPFLTSVIVTMIAFEVPSYIGSEVFLSYIGLGLSANVPSLGRMIQGSQSAFLTFPWAFWPPVFVASAIAVILYILGQNLADASDPRTHML